MATTLLAEGAALRGVLDPGKDLHFYKVTPSTSSTRVILRKLSKGGFQGAVDVYDHNEEKIAGRAEGVSLLPGINPQDQPVTLSFNSIPGRPYLVAVRALGSGTNSNYELTVRTKD
jgi:hypothetical protein